MSRNRKCRFSPLLIFWLLFIPWVVYSYFFGENSSVTLSELKITEEKLKKERDYWKERNELMEERLSAIKSNEKFYYEKLAREMFVKGKSGEEVILFVK